MLKIDNIDIKYNNEYVIKNFSLNIKEKEFVTIIGKSGCGKTTLFRSILSFVKPDAGKISCATSIAYQPQEDLLLPWLNVYENATICYKLKKINIDENKINEQLKDFNLFQAKEKFINQISGGMKTRVNLLRTFNMQGDLLLLDEPFTGVDTITKIGLYKWLKHLLEKEHKTVLYITHDIDEAIELSTKIIVVSDKTMQIKKVFNKEEFDKEKILNELLKGDI